jgi:hypothetical protein
LIWIEQSPVKSVDAEFDLEELDARHVAGAGLFSPFVVARLQEDANQTDAFLRVNLIGIPGHADDEWKILRIGWSLKLSTIPVDLIRTRSVTEWAACGVACAVLDSFCGVKLCELTRDGDRFDYWVTDGRLRFGLEVSGTIEQDLAARHREKVRQLRSSPRHADGYTAVVRFRSREVMVSFQRLQEPANEHRNG